MFTSLFFAFAALAKAQEVLYTGNNFRATVYYDIDAEHGTDVCAQSNGGPFPANWAIDSGINSGVTYCQGSDTTAWSLKELNSNRIVAMNYTMVSGDKAKWCGKEVQIFDSTGKQIILDEGPFVLFDGCAACQSTGIIDLSAKAFAAVKGGTCGGNNPEGLTVKILDNSVSPSGAVGGGSPAAPAATQASSSSDSAPTTTSSDAPTPTANDAPAASSSTDSSSSFSMRGTNTWWAPKVTAEALAAVPASASSAASSVADLASSVSKAASVAKASASSAGGNGEVTLNVPAAAPTNKASQQEPTASHCTIGEWRCEGAVITICNYINTSDLGWETVATCDNKCDISSSGSITCQ